MNSTTLTRRPALTAAVGYVCLHVALVIGSATVVGGDTGSLIAAGGLSVVYYLLITAFGMVLLAVTAPSLSRGWWIMGSVIAVALDVAIDGAVYLARREPAEEEPGGDR